MTRGEVFARRRKALARAVDHPILLAAGSPSPRNYEANVDDFRASSHFLFTVGQSLEGAFVLLNGDRATVFAHLAGPEDRLWHGDTPGPEALSELTGCEVRPLSELESAVPKGTSTIAAVRERTQLKQAELLGRSLSEPTPADRLLRQAMIDSRLIHDEGAVDGLTRAAAATTLAHLSGMKATTPGKLEAVVKAAIEAPLIAQNFRTAYHSIVTVHGEVLHNHHHHHTMKDGDLLLVDAGAETEDGWAGDVTRTWPVNGKFSTTQKLIYEVVLRSQQAGIDRVQPGVRYRDIHLSACRVLAQGLVDLKIFSGDPEELVEDGAHAIFFPHGVGHLIGLDVHDMEDLGDAVGYPQGRSRSDQFGLSYLRLDRDLAAGMAVTIEPGFYQVPAILQNIELMALAGDRLNRSELEKFSDVRGIRIEDDVLVTNQGPKVLSDRIPKSVEAVEQAVG